MTNFRLLLPVLLFAACGTHSVIQQSRAFANLGDYLHAYEVLEDARAAQAVGGGQVDADLAAAHATARREFLRARAQYRVFQEKEDKALEDLVELEALAPDYPGLVELRNRALRKKATRCVRRGDEHLLRREFPDALACYYASTSVLSNFPAAVDGIERVRQATSSMTVRAHEQFLEAVRKLPEGRFIEVQWHAGNVMHNDPTRADAKELQSKAQRENAQKAMARGKECEKKEQFGAAMLEYREAQRLDRNLTEATAAIALMGRELEAVGLLDRAQIEMRSNRYEIAREQLATAFELSALSRPQISELMMQCKKREGESRYQTARDLEVLGKKAEAVAGFKAIAADFPEGLTDEKARIIGLEVDIAGAGTEWAAAEAAEAAGDAAQAIEHYQNSERFYRGWKDGKARIARLQEEVAKKAATPPTTDGAQPPVNSGDAPPSSIVTPGAVEPSSGTVGTPPVPAPAPAVQPPVGTQQQPRVETGGD